MRAVLDTNVVVSALLWAGKPLTLLQRATDGDLHLFTSPALLDELRDVLSRGHLAKNLQRCKTTVTQALAQYAELAVTVFPGMVQTVITADPDDDHVIAAAVAAKADLIVSGDRHLLDLVRYGEILILNPAEALERIGATD
jgi:putative PIN family toxin of toxin-antitoxin system